MPSKSPDAFRTISEVADWLNTPAHVLRFWESKFSQVKPVKRAGGRRYYRPADMALLGGIKKLLHDDGMTIKGVQKILREQGIKHVSALSPPLDEELEAMIEVPVASPPPPVAPVAPVQETGQVLDFAGRSPAADTPRTAETPPVAPTVAPTAAPIDLFAEDDSDHDNLFGADDLAPTGDQSAETADAEALPDFVQKPMAERLAEDEAAEEPEDGSANKMEPPNTPTDAVTELQAKPDPELQPEPQPEPLAQALPDPAPEATPTEPEPQSAETAEDTPPPDPAILAAVLRGSDDGEETEEDDGAPRVQPIDTPPDPGDHGVLAAPGPLTLLTAPRSRDHGLPAEQIETLIARVRDHARAMNQAART